MSATERWVTGLMVVGAVATVAAVLLLWVLITQPFAVAEAVGSFR